MDYLKLEELTNHELISMLKHFSLLRMSKEIEMVEEEIFLRMEDDK
jgi:hypothetical protein